MLPLLRQAIVLVLVHVPVLFLFMPLNLLFLAGGKCGVHVFLCATLLAHPF